MYVDDDIINTFVMVVTCISRCYANMKILYKTPRIKGITVYSNLRIIFEKQHSQIHRKLIKFTLCIHIIINAR